jgi:hypothetical protein
MIEKLKNNLNKTGGAYYKDHLPLATLKFVFGNKTIAQGSSCGDKAANQNANAHFQIYFSSPNK